MGRARPVWILGALSAILGVACTITIGNAAQVCVAAGLTFLIMKQVPSIAAGLASGVALSSFGAISSTIAWGLGRARGAGRHLGQFGRGLAFDRET